MSAFDKIAAGMEEAISVARGVQKPGRWHIAPEIDVRAISVKTELSQDAFAQVYGFSVHQVRQWEQGRCRPLDGARAYLMLINSFPAEVRRLREAIQPPDKPDTDVRFG